MNSVLFHHECPRSLKLPICMRPLETKKVEDCECGEQDFWSETESSLKNHKDRGFPPQTFWWIARCHSVSEFLRTPKFLNKLGTQQHSQCKRDAMGGYGKAGCAHPRASLRRETQPKLLVLSPKWVS